MSDTTLCVMPLPLRLLPSSSLHSAIWAPQIARLVVTCTTFSHVTWFGLVPYDARQLGLLHRLNAAAALCDHLVHLVPSTRTLPHFAPQPETPDYEWRDLWPLADVAGEAT